MGTVALPGLPVPPVGDAAPFEWFAEAVELFFEAREPDPGVDATTSAATTPTTSISDPNAANR